MVWWFDVNIQCAASTAADGVVGEGEGEEEGVREKGGGNNNKNEVLVTKVTEMELLGRLLVLHIYERTSERAILSKAAQQLKYLIHL